MTDASDSLEHDIIGTTSLWDLVGLRSSRQRVVDQVVGAASMRNVVPSTHMRWRITEIRRANATMALFLPLRFATWALQVLSHVARPRFIMTVAAWHNARLRVTSPALVMPPDTSRSPDWLRDGVRPTQGPTFFEEVKRAGSSTADR